jgi:TetR/AcrR family transcriptional regulator, regulator of autoinduction and epiphytic fitness
MKLTRDSESNTDNNGEKFDQILQGAMQEFLARGYAGTSMERIAATAKVSKPTVYSYFKDKELLFQVLIEKLAKKKFNSTFGTKVLEGEPRVALRSIAEAIFKTTSEEDQEYSCFMRTIIGESGRFPELSKMCIINIFKPVYGVIHDYLTAHPELKISDPEAATSIFIGALVHHHISQNILHGKEVIPIDRSRIVDSLIELMLKSVED